MRTPCFFIFLWIIGLFPIVGGAQAAAEAEGSVFLPRGRVFSPLASDPRDLKVGLRKTNRNTFEGDIGAYRSFYGWYGYIKNKPTVLHAGIEGNAYFTMNRVGSRFPLESSDGLFGLYAEAARNFFLYQLRFTHISAHLADGSANVLQNIRYSREFFLARVAYTFIGIQPYGGLSYLVHTIPNNINKLGLQLGFYSVPIAKWKKMAPYFGADWRTHGGAEGQTFNFSFGMVFYSTRGTPPIRLAANYLNGNDLRGQFYYQKISKFSVGLELDL